jgi:hypothetical protein
MHQIWGQLNRIIAFYLNHPIALAIPQVFLTGMASNFAKEQTGSRQGSLTQSIVNNNIHFPKVTLQIKKQ